MSTEQYQLQGYTAAEVVYDPNDLIDQQAYLMGNSTVNRRSMTRTFMADMSGIPTQPISFDDYKPTEPPVLDINSLVLPPPNFSCYVEPPVGRGTVQYFKHNEPTITRTVTLNFNTSKSVVRENIVHHQHTQTVITNVNRNHWHTQRVVVKDNNYHHYLINNVVRINDVHHQKIEHVRGEGKSFKDFKQTQQIQAALCDFSDRDPKIVNLEGGSGGGSEMANRIVEFASASGGGGGSTGTTSNSSPNSVAGEFS